jgi:hypothetical protein
VKHLFLDDVPQLGGRALKHLSLGYDFHDLGNFAEG